jgi:hypothetical protein
VFNALNCTSGVLGRKLLLIHVILKRKLLWCDCAEGIFVIYVAESIESS